MTLPYLTCIRTSLLVKTIPVLHRTCLTTCYPNPFTNLRGRHPVPFLKSYSNLERRGNIYPSQTETERRRWSRHHEPENYIVLGLWVIGLNERVKIRMCRNIVTVSWDTKLLEIETFVTCYLTVGLKSE